MADRKDKINEQQIEQEIREEIREEMKHADQEPAQEQYSLNDDRRVKVLSPGMLVAKRFIRNRMAVTGLVTPGFHVRVFLHRRPDLPLWSGPVLLHR